jgi:rhodanese-related sulfurtransferase
MPPKSGTDLVNEAKSRIKEISASEVQELRARGEDIAIIDVREPNEWNLGHVAGAVLLPRGVIESNIEARVPRDKTVVLYCGGGGRSALAADTLQQMGYGSVRSLGGGFRAWAESGGEIEG